MAATLIACCALITWTALGRWRLPEIGPRQFDYYNLLLRGFKKGSLALDIPVPDALKAVKNPWNPAELPPGLGLPHDVSYWKGHFYLYFGVVPVVLLFWPFEAFTGYELPQVLGCLAFAIGSTLVTALLWLRLLRDHFPHAGLTTRVGGIAALGLVGGQLVLLRRVSIWEPSICAGNFFLICMLYSSYRAFHSRSPWGWLACSGTALGLAIGCRPTLAVAVVGLAWSVICIGALNPRGGRRSAVLNAAKGVCAAGIPLATIGIGLMVYNYERFGNPFEFGLNYQLSTAYKARHFSVTYVPYNFFAYFLATPQWGRYFPFLHPIVFRPQPAGYYGYEFVYGAFIVCPVILWAVCLPLLLKARDTKLLAFVGLAAFLALPITSVLLCFDTAAARYETDFLPWWVWLGMLGWAVLEDRAAALGAAVARRFLRFGLVVSVGYSCFIAFCASAELHGVLEFTNPESYHRIEALLNRPTAFLERATGFTGGALTMRVRFNGHPASSVEPLLVTGVEYQKDYVFVQYQRANVVRIGYCHPGEADLLSDEIPVDPDRSYLLRIQCGSLYPPEGYPSYDGWGRYEVDSLKSWVNIDLDGQNILSGARSANEASPGSIIIGRDPDGFYGRRFTGTIDDVRRVGWVRPLRTLVPDGEFNVVFTLPPAPMPLVQPLLVAGRSGHADLVGLNLDNSQQYFFAYESWGAGLWRGIPLSVPTNPHIATHIRIGSLLDIADTSPLKILKHSIVIWEGSTPVFWHRTVVPIGPSPPLYLMTNSIGSSAMDARFQGRFISAGNAPTPTWRSGSFKALEIRLGGAGDGAEPLLSTGQKRHSDQLTIQWLADGQALLIYDHWGQEFRRSRPFAWSQASTHTLKIQMPSFGDFDRSSEGSEERGPLDVNVDGSAAWHEEVPYYAAKSDSLVVGHNACLSSSAAGDLSCAVIDIRQLSSPNF